MLYARASRGHNYSMIVASASVQRLLFHIPVEPSYSDYYCNISGKLAKANTVTSTDFKLGHNLQILIFFEIVVVDRRYHN
jgi:hypothetical protein